MALIPTEIPDIRADSANASGNSIANPSARVPPGSSTTFSGSAGTPSDQHRVPSREAASRDRARGEVRSRGGVETPKSRQQQDRIGTALLMHDDAVDPLNGATEPLVPLGEKNLVGQFVVLLIEEFCKHYQLTRTALELNEEFFSKQNFYPESAVWFEMYEKCRSILTHSFSGSNSHSHSHSHSNSSSEGGGGHGPATLLEKLVTFCSDSSMRNIVLLSESVHSSTPMNVCVSPKNTIHKKQQQMTLMEAYVQIQSPVRRPSQWYKTATSPTSGHSSTPSTTGPHNKSKPSSQQQQQLQQQPQQQQQQPQPTPVSLMTSTAGNSTIGTTGPSSKKKKKKKKNNNNSSSNSLSLTSHHNLIGGASNGSGEMPPPMGSTANLPTYGDPALVRVHDTEMKRDLTAVRWMEKELRQIRKEKISNEKKFSLQKKLGFHGMDPLEEIQGRKDPYLNELLMEKHGLTKRTDCALCHFSFLTLNLPFRVSFKCIMDLYTKWNFTPPDQETNSKYKPPLCYDAVAVCCFCAQLLLDNTQHPSLIPNITVVTTATTECGSPIASNNKGPGATGTTGGGGRRRPSIQGGATMTCMDPFALPPLLGDDVLHHEEAYRREEVVEERTCFESPGKAIVYGTQVDGTRFMSSKEWRIINPVGSAIRQAMEETTSKYHLLRKAAKEEEEKRALAAAATTTATTANSRTER